MKPPVSGGELTREYPVKRFGPAQEAHPEAVLDTVIAEHSLSIFADSALICRIACLKQDLRELAAGHLFSEGYIGSREEILDMAESADSARMDVRLGRPCAGQGGYGLKPLLSRGFDPDDILALSNRLFEGSALFRATGSLHSCALSRDGEFLYRYEDIGRHNAMDKAVGAAFLAGEDFSSLAIHTSGRVPEDVAEKVIRCGIPILVSHSAVTDRAVELAKQYNLTLIGFARQNRFNLYTAATY